MSNYKIKMITTMFSEVKITETYCMANDFYKDLYCNRKNIWSKLVYFINGSGGARNWLRNDREMFSVAPYFQAASSLAVGILGAPVFGYS